MGIKKIQSFRDLNVWKESHSFVLEIYKVTNSFPQKEQFALTDQLRRASVSIPSNIAEGFSKNTKKDKIRFYNTSSGSLMEVLSQITLAKDLGYISEKDFKKLEEFGSKISRLISGVIKSAPDKKF